MVGDEESCGDLYLKPDAGINDKRDRSVGGDAMFEAFHLDCLDMGLLITHGMVFFIVYRLCFTINIMVLVIPPFPDGDFSPVFGVVGA
jgi:hypothetical protein